MIFNDFSVYQNIFILHLLDQLAYAHNVHPKDHDFYLLYMKMCKLMFTLSIHRPPFEFKGAIQMLEFKHVLNFVLNIHFYTRKYTN